MITLRAVRDEPFPFPNWTARAACRSPQVGDADPTSMRALTMVHLAGEPSDAHFGDDITPADNIAMMVCAECPVRPECLAYAYETEQTSPDYAGSWAAEFTPGEQALRFGIYGGIPGSIRERFALSANRLRECAAWFDEAMGTTWEEHVGSTIAI